MAPTLPEEIISYEILVQLPIKSLVRFKSVCKWWNSLFSDSVFTHLHLARTISQNPNNNGHLKVNKLTHLSPVHKISILCGINSSEDSIQEFPFCPYKGMVKLIGSINGLVFIGCRYHYIIWNPASCQRKEIILPESFFKCPLLGFHRSSFGFGWDSVSDNYKLIVKHQQSLQCFVYSCGTDAWSEIALFKDYGCGSWSNPFAIVKGCPYWIIHNSKGIIKFEVENNKFTFLPLSINSYMSSLVNLNDYLAVVARERIKYPAIVYRYDEQCCVWWKVYTINVEVMGNLSICFKYGGRILCNGKENLSNEIKDLGEEGYCYNAFNYTPSLVVVNGMKSLHAAMEIPVDHFLAY